MKNKTYDILKFIAQIVLPAIGTLYSALAGIWGFPYGEQIVGTIVAIDAFLGAILGISSAQYYKTGKDIDGTVHIDRNNETVNFDLANIDFDSLSHDDVLKVKIDASAETE